MTYLEVTSPDDKSKDKQFAQLMTFIDDHTIFEIDRAPEFVCIHLDMQHDKVEQELCLSGLGLDIEEMVPGLKAVLR